MRDWWGFGWWRCGCGGGFVRYGADRRESMGTCCGESSSFFMKSSFGSLVDDASASAFVGCGVSSFTSIDSVGVRSQSGES